MAQGKRSWHWLVRGGGCWASFLLFLGAAGPGWSLGVEQCGSMQPSCANAKFML